MGMPSPELKQLWIRVLKRVHPDLAIDEQDRTRCERLTQLANEAYQAGDIEALRAVLTPPQPPMLSSGSGFSFKQWLSMEVVVVILLCGGFSLYSLTKSRRVLKGSPAAQGSSVSAPTATHVEVGHRPPSELYGEVIHDKISRNLNPATAASTPAGATAVIGFTISHEGSPQNVSLVASSWSPSLDFACVNAVRQVRTFGPPEGGTKDSLNVIYQCSYPVQEALQQAPQQTNSPVAISAKPSHLYMKQMAERLHQSFSEYERVDANVPVGNSAELWFDVNRDGSLSKVRIGKASGWNSLDYACMRAVLHTPTVGALPEEYNLPTLSASFACTYTGSNALRTSRSVDPVTDRSNVYVGSVRDTNHQ